MALSQFVAGVWELNLGELTVLGAEIVHKGGRCILEIEAVRGRLSDKDKAKMRNIGSMGFLTPQAGPVSMPTGDGQTVTFHRLGRITLTAEVLPETVDGQVRWLSVDKLPEKPIDELTPDAVVKTALEHWPERR